MQDTKRRDHVAYRHTNSLDLTVNSLCFIYVNTEAYVAQNGSEYTFTEVTPSCEISGARVFEDESMESQTIIV